MPIRDSVAEMRDGIKMLHERLDEIDETLSGMRPTLSYAKTVTAKVSAEFPTFLYLRLYVACVDPQFFHYRRRDE